MTGPLLTGVHFLSNDELLDLVAQDHRAIINNPAVLLLKPALQGQSSWAELRAVNLRALGTAGKEIALAKTEAEAQAATLRSEKYSQAYNGINNTLFGIAERRLAQGPLLADRYLGLVGQGWLNPDAPEPALIPCEHWAAGTMDWQRRQLRMNQTNKMWSGVKVFDLSELPPEIAATVIGREVIGIDRPIVPRGALHDFLADRIQNVNINSPELGQDALWKAAQYHFSEKRVPRDWVRDWIKNEMPAPLRKKPGRPPMR
jgi:hypothetical protein